MLFFDHAEIIYHIKFSNWTKELLLKHSGNIDYWRTTTIATNKFNVRIFPNVSHIIFEKKSETKWPSQKQFLIFVLLSKDNKTLIYLARFLNRIHLLN